MDEENPVILANCILVTGGCGLKNITLSDFYGEDLEQVMEITIVDGSTGRSISISDENTISIFIEETREIKLIALKDQSGRDGFRFWLHS
ncbi:hypothetical protein [Bacillus sp. P14.5]|uniref:hypothetical protein n=1 Tax=Bacillus sp. P14.5 TaxID=1983400 RepID=UPI000DEB23C0|nr:hypothetical protein [Bacillus sp. P14.5]